MVSPRLHALPAPPSRKVGWPWTVESPPFACRDALRISVVTPSYMQADFLEETIRSVLLQGYPNLEYFVLDGGSTDVSREIIAKYAPWLARWRSERDRGQSAAVNEGWAMATGELITWINSDDWYQPGAFAAMAHAAAAAPGTDWFAGHVDDYTVDGNFIQRHQARPMRLDELLGRRNYGFHQPGMFWRRRHLRDAGMLDERLHMCFCPDFWARSLVAGHELQAVDAPIACFRRHCGSKTGGNAAMMLKEDRLVWRRYAKMLTPERRSVANHWLREFEADRLITSVYQFLLKGRRAQAFAQLVKHLSLLPCVRPPRLFAGALARTLFFRPPPRWFTDKLQ